MDMIFGLIGWGIIIAAAIYIPVTLRKSRKAASENGFDTVATV